MTDDHDAEFWEIQCAHFDTSLSLYLVIISRMGPVRASCPEEASFKSARALAEDLILCPSLGQAKLRIEQDREQAVSFYEMAHYVSDCHGAGQHQFQTKSDGDHGPFLLVASAVLNYLDYRESDEA